MILSAGAVAYPRAARTLRHRSGLRVQRLGVPIKWGCPASEKKPPGPQQLRPVFKVSGVKTLNVEYHASQSRAHGHAIRVDAQRTLTMAPSQLGAFGYSSPDVPTPNVQFHIQPLSLDKFGDPMHAFGAITVSVCNLRPSSRGSIMPARRRPMLRRSSSSTIFRPSTISASQRN